jgi:ABC-type molybdate transport system ATPase subunit
MVDLMHFRDAYPTDLSTGYKRAVAIARALAAQPECILYDEPTTMVDPIMSDILINLMLKLKHDLKLTAVVVTHDLDLMRKVADRVVFLYEGQAIYFGPVKDLDKATIRTLRNSWRWIGWRWCRVSKAASLLLKIQRCRIHAVAQTRRLRTVLKDVPQMRPALAAHHFNAAHAVRIIRLRRDISLIDRRKKARPTRTRFELRLRPKQRISTADARVGAVLMMVPVFPCEGGLSALLTGHLILFRRQFLTPFFVGFFKLILQVSPDSVQPALLPRLRL